MDAPSTPAFPGEDARPTSKKELSGWYFYGFAAEVFVVCGMSSFIPITLEQLARENGVLLEDHKTPCSANVDIGIPPPLDPAPGSTLPISSQANPPGQCIISFLGMDINTASFAMYTFSFSVLIQALLLISISTFADHGTYRKFLLLTFAFTGAIATMLFLPLGSQLYLLAATLAIIANTCIGSSFVLLNSFIPLLVRHDPTIQHKISASPLDATANTNLAQPDSFTDTYDDDDGEDSEFEISGMLNSTSALLNGDSPDQTKTLPKSPSTTSPELQLSTKISSNGIGFGYLASVIVQILATLIVAATGSTTFSLQLAIFFIGVWWLVFTIPAALWLRPRPGPPLRMDAKSSCFSYIAYAWRSLGRTAMYAGRLRDILLFLGAWFLLSDGIATVSGTAVLFAKTSLGMAPAALAMINVVVMIFGVIGAFTWSRVSRLLGLRPSQTILVCNIIFELIPLYGLLGFIPAVREHGVFGLQQPWEMYPLGAMYGLVLGGLSSYCRALFAELVPPGFEAAFFALYAITDKGSSIFGPAIVGAITDATGDIRPSFWFLAVLIGLPIPLIFFVDVERGKKQGTAMAKELAGDTEHRPRHPVSLET